MAQIYQCTFCVHFNFPYLCFDEMAYFYIFTIVPFCKLFLQRNIISANFIGCKQLMLHSTG